MRTQGKYKPLINSYEDHNYKMHFDIGRTFVDFSCKFVKNTNVQHLPLFIHRRLSDVFVAHKLH